MTEDSAITRLSILHLFSNDFEQFCPSFKSYERFQFHQPAKQLKEIFENTTKSSSLSKT